MKQTLEDDAIFLRELKIGHNWQVWVGLQFLREGFIVQVPSLSIRNRREEIDGYTDQGDIFLWRNSRDRLIFECKSRDLFFHNRDDYPFPTAFVDRKMTWERKIKSRPAAILLVSQRTGAIMAIGSWTQKEWVLEHKHDHVRDYDRDYYMVSRDALLEWPELVANIRGELRGLFKEVEVE